MASFGIFVDLSQLMPEGSPIGRDAFPHLAFAVQAITDQVETRWKQYAAGLALPDGKVIGIRSGQYSRSIMQRAMGDFATTVYSELPYASVIEQGAPRRDMKTMLNSSHKVRMTRSGKRYLIIPFRHSSNPNNVMRDNFIPESVADWWHGKMASSIKSGYERRAVHSDIRGTVLPWHAVYHRTTKQILTVPQRRYTWGARLTKSALKGLGATDQETKRMQGMVNFRRPGKSGGAAHSSYITFRVMMEGSRGWIMPPQEGKWPARQTAALYQPIAETAFRAAIEADIKSMMPGAGS